MSFSWLRLRPVQSSDNEIIDTIPIQYTLYYLYTTRFWGLGKRGIFTQCSGMKEFVRGVC